MDKLWILKKKNRSKLIFIIFMGSTFILELNPKLLEVNEFIVNYYLQYSLQYSQVQYSLTLELGILNFK
jgi:hypothetical protein